MLPDVLVSYAALTNYHKLSGLKNNTILHTVLEVLVGELGYFLED